MISQVMAIWAKATRQFLLAVDQVQRGIKLAEQQSAGLTAVSESTHLCASLFTADVYELMRVQHVVPPVAEQSLRWVRIAIAA